MMDEKVIKLINELFPKMTEKERLAFGIAFGADTGNGQKDYAGLEYIGHPLIVYSNCNTEDERIAALLHDVVEDTDITLEDYDYSLMTKLLKPLGYCPILKFMIKSVHGRNKI